MRTRNNDARTAGGQIPNSKACFGISKAVFGIPQGNALELFLFQRELRWIFFVPLDFALEFSAALDFPKRALEFGISIRSNSKKYSFVGKFLALIIGRGNNFKIENIGSIPY